MRLRPTLRLCTIYLAGALTATILNAIWWYIFAFGFGPYGGRPAGPDSAPISHHPEEAPATFTDRDPWPGELVPRFRPIIPGILWFFSAFIDERAADGHTILRIHTLGDHSVGQHVECLVNTVKRGRRIRIKGEELRTGEEDVHQKVFQYHQFRCSVAHYLLMYNNFTENGVELSAYYKDRAYHFNVTFTRVLKMPKKNNKKKYKLAACTKPIFAGHRQFIPEHFIEFVEWHIIVGYELIVIQNYARLGEVETVLRYYEKRGIVKLIDWDLPVALEETLCGGQPLAINDCMSRMIGVAEIVSVHDIDEFPISKDPQKTIPSLLPSLFKHDNACWGFQRTVFELKVTLKDNPLTSVPVTQLNREVVREDLLHQMIKSYVRPERVGMMNVHFLSECVPYACGCAMESDAIFMGHYKPLDEQFGFTRTLPNIENDIMKRHEDELMRRMLATSKALGRVPAYGPNITTF